MSELITNDAVLIGPKTRVTLHFSLLLPDGREIDSTRDGKPATFTFGDGSLLPGFEAVLVGQKAGFSEQILIPAEAAFGERNLSNVQSIDKQKFIGMIGMEDGAIDGLEEGLIVSFQAPDGELPGVVQAVYETNVLVDFNHPLSGTDIVFDVAIVRVEAI